MARSWAHQSDLRRRLSIFLEFRIAEFPDPIISASGVISSHILLLHDDFCALAKFFSIFQLFDLCFLDFIKNDSFNFVRSTSIFYLNKMMLATSSSSNFTPFKYRAGRIRSCGGFSAALIHVLLFFISFPVVFQSLQA